nr:polysaccharide pyruvyl transferase family protein [Alcanivorax quisquiliarum]
MHWSASKNNFGDVLSPLIVERVSSRPVIYESIEKADLVAIGSLLQRLKESFWSRRLHVWGSGFISPERPRQTRHYIHAVRGLETASILKKEDEGIAIGDPGLLVGLLRDQLNLKRDRFPLVVVPHYQDKDSEALRHFLALNPSAIQLDIQADPLTILEVIGSARLVVSSAMHGLIAADGLGVPNVRARFSDRLRGGDFKFQDYYSAFKIGMPDVTPLAEITDAMMEEYVDGYARPGLDDVLQNLIAAFPRAF